MDPLADASSGPTSASPRHSPPPSNQAPKPKGILKNPLDRRPSEGAPLASSPPSSANTTANAPTGSGGAAPLRLDMPPNGINWDEANIALHDFEKESTQRMKIDEPKTPFVRGAGSDEEGGLDAFNLDGTTESPRATSSQDAQRLAANTSANAMLGHGASPPNGRGLPSANPAVGLDAAELAGASASSGPSAASGSSQGARRPSLASRSSRSPSFSLPPSSGSSSRRASSRSNSGLADSRSGVRADASAMDVDGTSSAEQAIGADDDDEDEDEETRAQKEAFAKKRNAHYGNEAEALKVAKALAAQEDDEDADEDEEEKQVPPVPRVPNGV